MTRKKAAPPDTPPQGNPHGNRVPIYYDGSRGELTVPLRGGLTALRFEAAGIRLVPLADAQDLVSPAIGGGAFVRALSIEDAAAWRPPHLRAKLDELAASGAITVVSCQLAGEAAPRPFLVLDARTRKRLAEAPLTREG